MHSVKSTDSNQRSSCNTSDYEGDAENTLQQIIALERRKQKKHHEARARQSTETDTDTSAYQGTSKAEAPYYQPTRITGSSKEDEFNDKQMAIKLKQIYKRLNMFQPGKVAGRKSMSLISNMDTSGRSPIRLMTDTDYEADIETATVSSVSLDLQKSIAKLPGVTKKAPRP